MMNLDAGVIFDPQLSVIAGAIAFTITAGLLSFPARKGFHEQGEALLVSVLLGALFFGIAIAGQGVNFHNSYSEPAMFKSELLRVYGISFPNTGGEKDYASDLRNGEAIFFDGQYIIFDRETSSLLVLTDTEPLPAKK